MSSTNGTTTLDNVVKTPRAKLTEAEKQAKNAKKAARKARQNARTIEGNMSTLVARVFVGEVQALTMSFKSPEELQGFIWMQLLEVDGPAVVAITK